MGSFPNFEPVCSMYSFTCCFLTIRRTEAEAEASVLWHLMQRVNSLERTLILGRTEGKRRRGWQRIRRLDGITDSNGDEFEQTPGDSEGKGGLVCCSPWDCKELVMI